MTNSDLLEWVEWLRSLAQILHYEAEQAPFQHVKLWLVDNLGIAKDAMHVIIGLMVMLVTIVILRREFHHKLPIFMVILAALAGEMLDLLEVNIGMLQQSVADYVWHYAVHDICLTAGPALLVWLTANYVRWRNRRRDRRAGEQDSANGNAELHAANMDGIPVNSAHLQGAHNTIIQDNNDLENRIAAQ